jgi:hypothetical protein
VTSSRCPCPPATHALPSPCSHTGACPECVDDAHSTGGPLLPSPSLFTCEYRATFPGCCCSHHLLARRAWPRLASLDFLILRLTLTVHSGALPTARRVHQEAPGGAGGVCHRRPPLRRAVAEVEPEKGHIQQVGDTAASLHTARHGHDPRGKPQGAFSCSRAKV